MPQQRMDIRMIKDILRLKYNAVLSHEAIARARPDSAVVVDEGAATGVLPKNEDLGKAYSVIANQAFFANDLAAAVKYYTLAAPLSPDGEAWLNLAKVYNNQGNKAEQRKAAQQALAKGVKDTAEAQRLANPK